MAPYLLLKASLLALTLLNWLQATFISASSCAISRSMADVELDVDDWDEVFDSAVSDGEYCIDESIPVDDGGFPSIPPSYEQLTGQVLDLLRSHGLSGTRLALQAGSESEMLTQALVELQVQASFEARGYVLQGIYKAVERAEVEGRISKRARGDQANSTLARVLDVVNYQSRTSEAVSAVTGSLGWKYPLRGKRRAGPLSSAGTAGQLSKVERDSELLKRSQALLVFYMLEASVPSALLASGSSDQRRALADLIGKTRGSTAAGYLKRWTTMREWLVSTGQDPWPSTPGPLLDYIHMLADEPCRPTVPQAWLQSVQFLYKLGGFRGDNNPSTSMIVLKAVDKLTTDLGQFVQPILQAARYPVVVLAALEVYVVKSTAPPFKRIQAGSMLLKSWATLRFDDVQHLKRGSLRRVGNVVQSTLLSSKTSGPGKRIKQLPVVIANKAELLDLGWLSVFLKLVDLHMPDEQDWLLDQCTADFTSSLKKELRYSQSSALSKMVISELRVPVFVDGKWEEGTKLAVPPELFDLFTEHSGRCVIPSLCLWVEEDKSKRDMVGRWRPSGADDYARTFRFVIGNMQCKIADALKAGEGAGKMAEADIVDRAGRFLRERKLAPEETIGEVCTAWDSVLLSFARYLGQHSTASPEPVPLASFPAFPIVPITSGLDEEIKRGRTRVVRHSKYLVSQSRNKKVSRLHLASGGCYWANSEIRDCTLYEDIEPSLYNARCKFCFPEPIASTKGASDSSSEDSFSD